MLSPRSWTRPVVLDGKMIPPAPNLAMFGEVSGSGRVNTQPPQNDLILFNERLSYFSETTHQNCKSCSQSLRRGESFDLQLYWEPKSHPSPHDIEGPGHNRDLRRRILSDAKGPGRYGAEAPYHKCPSSKVLQVQLAPPGFPHTDYP